MLGINQLDFMSYATALKSNYRKGIRRLEAILSNPTHAAEFAANLGGVSVVLGVPIGREDRNSDALLSLLLNSDIADDAVLTWMHQFYEFTTWDDLMGNSARVQEMMQNPFLWRALGGSKKAVGKGVATLAGLSCASYTDIDAVVASSTAMAAVAASSTAMTAIQKSQTAKDAIAASSMATAKYAAGAAGLNPADYADMTVLAASSTAMAAVAASSTAMAAVAASSTAMAAVAASTTARAAIYASDVAFNHLLSLATYDTVSGTTTGNGWSTRYSKPCIVLQWCYSYQSGTSGIRTCLDGNASRQYTGSQRYNSSINSSNYNDHEKKPGTYYKEFVFCSKLETYNSQSDWPAISIAYFKLP